MSDAGSAASILGNDKGLREVFEELAGVKEPAKAQGKPIRQVAPRKPTTMPVAGDVSPSTESGEEEETSSGLVQHLARLEKAFGESSQMAKYGECDWQAGALAKAMAARPGLSVPAYWNEVFPGKLPSAAVSEIFQREVLLAGEVLKQTYKAAIRCLKRQF
jgi:hypothetical protein